MEISISVFGLILICAGYFIAGIIDSVCGGGGLITIPVLVTAGLPVNMITGTNQCAAVLGGGVSTISYARAHRINYKVGLVVIPFAMLGGALGSRLNMLVSERFLQWLMLLSTPCVAALIFTRKDIGAENRILEVSQIQVYIVAAMIGLIIGTYQGFYGPGAGMLFMLALAAFEKLDMLSASGTSRMIGTLVSISATVTYASSGLVIWKAAAIGTVFNMLGNYIGAQHALSKGQRIIKPILFVVLTLLMIKLIIDLYF